MRYRQSTSEMGIVLGLMSPLLALASVWRSLECPQGSVAIGSSFPPGDFLAQRALLSPSFPRTPKIKPSTNWAGKEC